MNKGLFLLIFLFFTVVSMAQNVGIGTPSPLATLHIKGGLLLDSSNGTTPVSGAGTRMMWIPAKAAFRAGTVTYNQWDDVNIGISSFASGANSYAKGDYSTGMGSAAYAAGIGSVAIGQSNIANGNSSIAMGYDNTADGTYSIAMGYGAIASKDYSTSVGFTTKADGTYSTALGSFTIAAGNYSTAFGYSNYAGNDYTTAFGRHTVATGLNATAMGSNTNAIGAYSTAIGYSTSASGILSTAGGSYTKSKYYGDFVIGMYNDSTDAVYLYNINPLNRIFEIGNGTADNARSNALTVLQNGNVGIGTINPIAPLNFASSVGNKIILWTNGTTHYGMGVQPSLYQLFTDTQGADIAFGYGNSSSFSENMRIKGSGNVGIGTNSPNSMLTVKNDINVDNGDGNAGTTSNTIKFGGNGSGEAIGSNRTTATNQFGLDFYTYGANRMSITLGGNVGIGTTAPSAKLSVNGSANNATGNWGVFSDARVKTITGNFTDGLNVISQINPVVFNYNNNAPFKTSDKQIGIVAQELEKIAPYMVSKQAYNQFTDLREVNNQAYVFLLINAVKEQQEQIAAEQQANEILKQRLEKLEKLISSLGLK
jgi:hypothetical protein